MNTSFALMCRFESPYIPLRVVAEEFLGIKSNTAEQRAKALDLPFPTVKMRDSERSPTMVKIDDLAQYLDARYHESKAEWESVKA